METEAAERLLDKVRTFMKEQLDDEERLLFAALIAPGVAQAYGEREVAGFQMVEWMPDALPQALVRVIREKNFRVVGPEP